MMSGQASLSYQCPFCPSFLTPTLKSWLGHIRLVHQSDPRIPCCIDQCKETFCKYSSLKSHMYRRHRDHIDGDVKQKEPESLNGTPTVDDCTVIEPKSSQDSTPVTLTHDDFDTDHTDHCSSLQVERESCQDELSLTMPDVTQSAIIDRNVAMHLLKLKEVHHLSQAAIDCVVSGTKSLLDQQLTLLKEEVDRNLQQAQLPEDHAGLLWMFEGVHDPFARLSSAYMQEKYFRDNFHLVVSSLIFISMTTRSCTHNSHFTKGH